MVRYGADENDSDLRYSEVPLKGKIKHLQNIGGRQHRMTPADQILGGCDPCGADAYEYQPVLHFHFYI